MKWEAFVALGLELPEVEESTSYGRPALKVSGKFIAGWNPNENAFVLRLASVEEQQLLIEMAPQLYYITDHYAGYPAVLIRPAKLTKSEARGRLRNAWRLKAPSRLRKQFDAD